MIKVRGNSILHHVDRLCGIPAVALLGKTRRKRAFPSKMDVIGLLKPGAIGDTVLMSAAIADLRSAFPNASLVLFAAQTNSEIASMLEGVDRIVKVPVSDPFAGVAAVRSVPVDVMLDFGQWSRLEAVLARMSRSLFTIGFRTPKQYRHYAYDRMVDHSPEVHELENYRNIVRALGAQTRNQPFLRAPREGMALPGEYAVFHLWPGGRLKKLKEWPSERWLELIEEIVGRDLEVLLTGAPSDYAANDALIERASSASRNRVKNAAGVNLRETAWILARSRLVVSVNTGVMHMAAALGVPLVALHGPTSSKRWGPVGEQAIIVNSPLAGCGYLNLGWEHHSGPPACMQCITYETVRDACIAVLVKAQGPRTGVSRFVEGASPGKRVNV